MTTKLAQGQALARQATVSAASRGHRLGAWLWRNYRISFRVGETGSSHRCEETEGMIGDQYLRCGDPAKTLVKHRGRSEGPYWMCPVHADHNIHNRDAEDVTPELVQ